MNDEIDEPLSQWMIHAVAARLDHVGECYPYFGPMASELVCDRSED